MFLYPKSKLRSTCTHPLESDIPLYSDCFLQCQYSVIKKHYGYSRQRNAYKLLVLTTQYKHLLNYSGSDKPSIELSVTLSYMKNEFQCLVCPEVLKMQVRTMVCQHVTCRYPFLTAMPKVEYIVPYVVNVLLRKRLNSIARGITSLVKGIKMNVVFLLSFKTFKISQDSVRSSNLNEMSTHIAYHIHYNVLLPTVCSGCNSLSPPLDDDYKSQEAEKLAVQLRPELTFIAGRVKGTIWHTLCGAQLRYNRAKGLVSANSSLRKFEDGIQTAPCDVLSAAPGSEWHVIRSHQNSLPLPDPDNLQRTDYDYKSSYEAGETAPPEDPSSIPGPAQVVPYRVSAAPAGLQNDPQASTVHRAIKEKKGRRSTRKDPTSNEKGSLTKTCGVPEILVLKTSVGREHQQCLGIETHEGQGCRDTKQPQASDCEHDQRL
ncbi:hypothetical protein U0070_014218 [Myodes glareolus]|uniref:Uncharacterized protein n=1 Tax=Myodes glareolus TaxID=447135 RepID=A0AAW0IMU3_MYOGA